MKTNLAGIELIKAWEGLRTTAYQDSVGVWTIGYGHTSMAGEPKVTPGMRITPDQATAILANDLGKYESAVSSALKRTPTGNQFAAMVSLCFNVGPGNFLKSSVLTRFNAGDMQGAADAFLMWNKAGGKVLQGLVNRREAERKLFLAASSADAGIEPPKPETPPVTRPVAGKGIGAVIVGALMALAAAIAAYFIGGK
mgnify:FL=1